MQTTAVSQHQIWTEQPMLYSRVLSTRDTTEYNQFKQVVRSRLVGLAIYFEMACLLGWCGSATDSGAARNIRDNRCWNQPSRFPLDVLSTKAIARIRLWQKGYGMNLLVTSLHPMGSLASAQTCLFRRLSPYFSYPSKL